MIKHESIPVETQVSVIDLPVTYLFEYSIFCEHDGIIMYSGPQASFMNDRIG